METLLVAAVLALWLLLLVPAALVTLVQANPLAAGARNPRPGGPIPFPPAPHDTTGAHGGQAVA